ncbi:MAG: response regulator, partial [Verrucomicrobiota bacterium]
RHEVTPNNCDELRISLSFNYALADDWDSGRVVVRARLEASALVFEVEDTGMGISAHDEKMIFEPFRQAKTSGFKRNEGSGLGLAISKRLARLMSGDLKYAKSITGGSLFQFRMPMVEAERVGQEVVDESKTATEVSGVARSGKRILVVEDNQLNADIISHFLRDYGFEFEVVDDGRKAINAYEDGKYDLILMDIMLPEVNGYEATEAILKKKADKVALPIVGVTAKVFRDDRQRCLDSGMVEVIHKPVDFDLLRSTLDRFLFSSESREGMEAYLFESNPNVSNAPMKKCGVVELRILSEYLDRMGAESGKKAVIDKYLISVSGMLNELQESADREDHSEFERLAHSIKGSAGLVGAWDLQDMAKGAEMAASASGDSFRPGHWVTLVRESFKLVERKIYSFSPSDFDVS